MIRSLAGLDGLTAGVLYLLSWRSDTHPCAEKFNAHLLSRHLSEPNLAACARLAAANCVA